MNQRHKIYTFSFFWMFLVIMPVIVPFFTSVGLSMQEIFLLQAIFGISVVILEVPTGYICDLWGRKNSLVLGSACSGLSFTLLLFVDSFTLLVAYEVLIALALSLVSGADISLLYDSLKDNGRSESTKSLANMHLATLSGESIAALLGGLLAAYSLRYTVVANAIVGWVPLFLALRIKEPASEKMHRSEHRKNFAEVFRHIFLNHDRILFLSFLNLIVWGLSTFFAVWMFQRYWELNNVSLAYFGLIWAAYNLSAGLMGKMVHGLELRFGAIPLMVFLAAAPIFGYLGMSLFSGVVGILLGFLFYLSRGITSVLLKDAVNWRTPAKFRATVNSLQSFFFRLGFAIFGPGVGFVIDRFGMNAALSTLGLSFMVLFALVMIPLLKAIRAQKIEQIPVGG